MRSSYGRYIKNLCVLAFPVMLEQLGQIFLGTVDTFFAGTIGDNAIAAINVTNMFMNLFCTVFAAFGIGVMVLIARALGQKDEALANRLVRQSVLLATAVGLGLGLINLFLCRPILQLAGAKGEILEMGITYYLVVCVPCFIMGLTQVLAYGLKAAQNTKASMIASLAANLTNVALDALFLKLGLGVFGLGLATTLSRLLNVLLLVRLYRKKVTALHIDRSGWKPESVLMRELVSYSAPVMLTQFSARLAMTIHGSLILHLGDVFYVSNSIATQIDEFACIPSAGFEAATATMVSNSIGAGKKEDVLRYTGTAFVSTSVFMTSIGLVLALFAGPLASIFTETQEVQGLVAQVLSFMVLFDWTSALSHILTSSVQGTGDSKFPLYVTLLGNIIMRLGAGYVLAYFLHWNLIGVWTGIVMDFLLRGILLGRRLLKEYSRKTLSVQ